MTDEKNTLAVRIGDVVHEIKTDADLAYVVLDVIAAINSSITTLVDEGANILTVLNNAVVSDAEIEKLLRGSKVGMADFFTKFISLFNSSKDHFLLLSDWCTSCSEADMSFRLPDGHISGLKTDKRAPPTTTEVDNILSSAFKKQTESIGKPN